MPSAGAISESSMNVPLSTTRSHGRPLTKPFWARSVWNDRVRFSPGSIGMSKAKMR